jgi:hypothetical protein
MALLLSTSQTRYAVEPREPFAGGCAGLEASMGFPFSYSKLCRTKFPVSAISKCTAHSIKYMMGLNTRLTIHLQTQLIFPNRNFVPLSHSLCSLQPLVPTSLLSVSMTDFSRYFV